MKIQVTSKSCGSPAVFSMHWRAGTWLWPACERLASRKWFKTPDCITSCRDSFHQLHIGTLHPCALIKWLLTGNNNLLHMQHRREINLQMQGCVNMSFFFSKSSQRSGAPLIPELQPALLVNFHAAWYVTVYLRLKIENFPLNLQVTPLSHMVRGPGEIKWWSKAHVSNSRTHFMQPARAVSLRCFKLCTHHKTTSPTMHVSFVSHKVSTTRSIFLVVKDPQVIAKCPKKEILLKKENWFDVLNIVEEKTCLMIIWYWL